jgi:hypothetical protein
VAAAPLAGRRFELAAVQAQNHSRFSMACARYRWLNVSRAVGMRSHCYEVARSEVCAFLDRLGTTYTQHTSLWLAALGVWQVHSSAMALCWHSLHRRSHRACSCCLGDVRFCSSGETSQTYTLAWLHRTSSFFVGMFHSQSWYGWQIAIEVSKTLVRGRLRKRTRFRFLSSTCTPARVNSVSSAIS